ncbi:hypothetical protein NL676_009337 [Syzygium grande]|nr:hypothetical protein NL676_009337 [Syzygium grande]
MASGARREGRSKRTERPPLRRRRRRRRRRRPRLPTRRAPRPKMTDGDDAPKEEEGEEDPKGGSSVEKQGRAKEEEEEIERPTRERTSVERCSAPALVRTPSSKGFPIEKGRGIQLKDIPNGMFPALIVSSWFTVGLPPLCPLVLLRGVTCYLSVYALLS